MKYQSFFKQILFALFVILFASCDNDANEVGTNIVGDDNFTIDQHTYEVAATNQMFGPVDSGNLDINSLGVYDNGVMGKTTANFAAELLLSSTNPTIDLERFISITDVTLSVPYYSTYLSTDAEGKSVYRLDSISGDPLSKLKLKIYRSRKYLSNSDPDAKLYNNDNELFKNAVTDADLLYDSNSEPNGGQFTFSPKGQTEETLDEDTGDTTTTDVTPRMKILLDKEKFKQYIFSPEAQSQLINNGVFKEYFRGLYFNVELVDPSKSVMGMLNFKGGKVVIRYTEKDGSVPPKTLNKSMSLTMTGNMINLLDRTGEAPVANPEQKLILNGGQGSMAIINLFPDDATLTELKTNRRLINDASLTFYVDNESIGSTAKEPERIYLYDLNTGSPILDYYSDQTTNVTYAAFNKTVYGGILEKTTGENKRGIKYKIRLTNHLISLLDSENPAHNARLGLVVTENINTVTGKALKNTITLSPIAGEDRDLEIKAVPQMMVAQPFGTILWGSNVPANSPDYAKRVKLEVIYTKPN